MYLENQVHCILAVLKNITGTNQSHLYIKGSSVASLKSVAEMHYDWLGSGQSNCLYFHKKLKWHLRWYFFSLNSIIKDFSLQFHDIL